MPTRWGEDAIGGQEPALDTFSLCPIAVKLGVKISRPMSVLLPLSRRSKAPEEGIVVALGVWILGITIQEAGLSQAESWP